MGFREIRVGRPIKFAGMAYAPTNEQGVVYLFGRLAPRLGFHIECVQTAFPDCVARRNGKTCRIKFEYRASSYACHPANGADIIVCWDNDWANTRTNHRRWPLAETRFLFEECDRARLLAAGDSLPEGERFTVYRGVAGRGGARRIGGFSWTGDLERARRFANRFVGHDPAVYALEAARADVLAYVNWRKEQEFIVIPKRAAIKRLNVPC